MLDLTGPCPAIIYTSLISILLHYRNMECTLEMNKDLHLDIYSALDMV